MAYLARVDYTADGATHQFVIPFPYLAQSHVHLFQNGVVDNTTVITWMSSSLVYLNPAPSAAAVVSLRRQTPQAPLANFQLGSINPADLNTDFLQAIYLMQEAIDGASWLLSNSLAVPDIGVPLSLLPSVASRASRAVAFDANGSPTVSVNTMAAIDAIVSAAIPGVQGSRLRSVVTKTGNYSALATDDWIIVDASAGPVTITIAPATAAYKSFTVSKKDTSGNAVSISDGTNVVSNLTEPAVGGTYQTLDVTSVSGGLVCT